MSNYYDYTILSNQTPAFADNISLMCENILAYGGTSPTIVGKFKDGAEIPDTDPVEYEQIAIKGTNPMPGTKEKNGRIMLHFSLPDLLEGNDLKDMLEAGMSNPKPPISIELTRSATETVWVSDGVDEDDNPIGHYEYHYPVVANKAKFLPYMGDVSDGVDGNDDPITRPPNMQDDLYLSQYFGSEPVEL